MTWNEKILLAATALVLGAQAAQADKSDVFGPRV